MRTQDNMSFSKEALKEEWNTKDSENGGMTEKVMKKNNNNDSENIEALFERLNVGASCRSWCLD